MGCQSCSDRRARAEADMKPYEITLPNGKKKTVANKAEERAVRDQYYATERAEARAKGYRLGR